MTWNRLAIADRDTIMSYIAQDNPVAALELDEMIEEKADKLLLHPTMYRVGRQAGTREMVLHPNYILIYRIKPDEIEVLRVVHAAMKWPE